MHSLTVIGSPLVEDRLQSISRTNHADAPGASKGLWKSMRMHAKT